MTRPIEIAKSPWILTLPSIAIVVATLYLAQGVLIPLTLAVLLSFLLAPVCDWLERWRTGRIPAVIAAVTLAFVVLGIVAWIAAMQMTDLARHLPQYRSNLEAKLHSLDEHVSVSLHKLSKSANEISHRLTLTPENAVSEEERTFAVRVVPVPTNPLRIVGSMFGTVFGLLGTSGIVVILVIFFLLRREDLRDRFIRLFGQGQETMTTQALGDAAQRVSQYLAMQLLINAGFGICTAVGLFWIGVPNAALWGLLATALRFIPYLGPWLAAAMPLALSLAISTHWREPIFTLAMFLVLELWTNNVMEPWLYGQRTGVSAVAVLVAAIFWTWLWGGAGLLLSTPLTVCLLVLGKYVPQLAFLDTLLGNEPVFEPKMRVYQRLLAGDQEEAADLVEAQLAKKSLLELYDTVLLPALAMAERDRYHDELDDRRQSLVYQGLKDLVADFGDRELEKHAVPVPVLAVEESEDPERNGSAPLPKPCVLCLPARDEADEIVAVMLAQLLTISGYRAESVPVACSARALAELVAAQEADMVCVSAMPASAALRTRSLCKRLRNQFPKLPLVVGLWTLLDLKKARERIGVGESMPLVTTLADAQEQIRRLIEPLAPRPETPASLKATLTRRVSEGSLAHASG